MQQFIIFEICDHIYFEIYYEILIVILFRHR